MRLVYRRNYFVDTSRPSEDSRPLVWNYICNINEKKWQMKWLYLMKQSSVKYTL
jgi:hypothetical protein